MPGSKSQPAGVSARMSAQSHKTATDEVNRGIISILQEDGRTPYSTIATELGVSEGAIRKRVNRLQEAGALRVVAVVDPLELSYDAYTMLGIRVTADAHPEAVAGRLSDCPGVVYAIWVSGPYDLLIEVVFRGEGPVCGIPVRSGLWPVRHHGV